LPAIMLGEDDTESLERVARLRERRFGADYLLGEMSAVTC
jgi:hypothetical protein